MIVGITGLIGSGKSIVGKQLESFGLHTLDCDHIGHDLYSRADVVNDIEDVCGKCRNPDNTFSRKKLLKFLYNNPRAIKDVDFIVHPLIIRETEKIIIQFRAKNQHLVVLAPLLFECHMEHLFDTTVYIYTDYVIRKYRLMKFRKFRSEKHIEFFDVLQIPPEKKFLICDHVLLNNSDRDCDLYKSIETLFMKIF